MIITAGQFRGRKISSAACDELRPTSSKVRQAIFNTLFSMGFNLDSVRVLDLFAGSGIMSFEAVSRGASYATLIDNSSRALKNIDLNIKNLGLEAKVRALRLDSLKFVEENSLDDFDLILMDPPYDYKRYLEISNLIIEKMPKDALLLVESEKTVSNSLASLQLKPIKQKSWGSTFVSFFLQD